MENEPLLPADLPSTKSDLMSCEPSPKQQSWGAVISIIIIVLMIIVGAFYAWGQRISENVIPVVPSADESTVQ